MKAKQTAGDFNKLEQKWRLSIEPYTITAPEELRLRAPRPQIMPVYVFVADGLRVSCRAPVQVEVLKDGDSVFLNCDRLHVFASGESYEEAMTDLCEQVVHFYRHYTGRSQDDFIGEA